MSFPDYKKGKWPWSSTTKDGWEDMGKVDGEYLRSEDGHRIYKYDAHSYCSNIVRIGKENGSLFKYCPVCMVKIISSKKNEPKKS